MKKSILFMFVMSMMLVSFKAGVEYQRGDVDQDGSRSAAEKWSGSGCVTEAEGESFWWIGYACALSHFITPNALTHYGVQPARLLCPWASPGKNTGVVAMPSSRGSSRPRDRMSLMSSAVAGGLFTTSATWEAHLIHTTLPLWSIVLQRYYT